MKVPMAGLPIVGLLISPEGKHSYCLIKDEFSPDLVYRAIGTRNFGFGTRYLGPIKMMLVYDRDEDQDEVAIPTVFNERSNVVVRGPVIIFGVDDDGSFRSLSEFEVSALRDVTIMMRYNDVTYFAVEKLTRNPSQMQLVASYSEERPPDTSRTISLMEGNERITSGVRRWRSGYSALATM